MGILFKVHNELGPSLLEKYYQRAIESELHVQKLKYKKEVMVKILYNNENIGRYFLDFLVEDVIILEIKAQANYSPKFFKQAYAYLKQVNAPLAIISNFKGTRLRTKRIINSEFRNEDLSEKDITATEVFEKIR